MKTYPSKKEYLYKHSILDSLAIVPKGAEKRGGYENVAIYLLPLHTIIWEERDGKGRINIKTSFRTYNIRY